MKTLLRSRALTILFSAAVSVLAIARGADANPPGFGNGFEDVVQLAIKEGKVRYGSSLNRDEARLVLEGFEKTYPKVKVEYTPNVDGGVSERVMTEAMAGTIEYDLVNVPSGLQARFKKAGVLAKPLEWRRIFPNNPAEHFSPDNAFAVVSFIPRVIAYNPSLVPPERVPKSWQDCLDPYWKGRFTVRVRPHAFVGAWTAWGEEKTLDYVKRIKENQPIWGRASYGESAAQITTGEVPMMCGIHYTTVFNVVRRDPQAKIAAVFPTETPVGMGETIGILKGAKSPNGAFLLAGWLASLEGQKGYEKIGRASPFVEGSEMRSKLQKASVKIIFGGWEEEQYAPARIKKITAAWGFR